MLYLITHWHAVVYFNTFKLPIYCHSFCYVLKIYPLSSIYPHDEEEKHKSSC